jgi:DNA-binding GntR family transcriptional regulator
MRTPGRTGKQAKKKRRTRAMPLAGRSAKVGPTELQRGKLRPLSLRDQTHAAIKHRIITCAYRPGEYLNEYQISDELGFGRTPVHQALTLLQMQGLLEIIPGKGVFVKPLDLNEILHVTEARLANELECVRLAAERITVEELDLLQANLEQADKALRSRDIEALMRLDRDFHDGIACATRNPVLTDILKNLHERSLRVWFISLNDAKHLERVQGAHEDILAALRAHDGAAASAAMKAHIAAFRKHIGNSI